MDRKTGHFAIVALAVALALGVFAAPFASSLPDGLDKFAQDQKLAQPAEGKEVWTHAPLPDYKVRGVRNESVSTGIAGAAGTLAVFALGLGLARLLARRRCGELRDGMEPPMNTDEHGHRDTR